MTLFWDHPGEPMAEENFWTLWCKGRLTEADTLTVRLGTTPSGLTNAYVHHPRIILTELLKMKAFSKSQGVRYDVKLVVSQKQCKIVTLELQ